MKANQDKEAQDNLPQHIKDKMKANQDKAIKEQVPKVLNIHDVSNSTTRRPYKIVCIYPYEFEGIKFIKGEIGYHSFGRLIPDGWRKATIEDVNKWNMR